MKPTITIDLEEYKTLDKMRDFHAQSKMYCFFHSQLYANVLIFNADDTTKALLASNKYLKERLDESLLLEKFWRNKCSKKWYQFWK